MSVVARVNGPCDAPACKYLGCLSNPPCPKDQWPKSTTLRETQPVAQTDSTK